MLNGLIELLETLVDLRTVVRSDLFVDHDELVKVADAAVRIVTSLVNAMAFWALLLALGTLVFQMSLQILSRYLDELACVTRDQLHWTHRKMCL